MPDQAFTDAPLSPTVRQKVSLQDLVTKAATDANLDPAFVHRLIKTESDWNPSAVGPALPRRTERAVGLMQVLPSTAKQYGVTNLTDPAENVKAGIGYLKDLSARFPGRQDLVAAAYNAGPGAVEKAGGVPNFAETQAYVKKVASSTRDESAATFTDAPLTPPKSGPPPGPRPILRSRTGALYSPPAESGAREFLQGAGEAALSMVDPRTYINAYNNPGEFVRGLVTAPARIVGGLVTEPARTLGGLSGGVAMGEALPPTVRGTVRTAKKSAPAAVKYGTTAVGYKLGGLLGGIFGRELGADLADALRARLQGKTPVRAPATAASPAAATPPRPSLPSAYDRYMPNVSGTIGARELPADQATSMLEDLNRTGTGGTEPIRSQTLREVRTMTGQFAGGTGPGGVRTVRDIGGDFPEGPEGLSSAGRIPKLPGPGKTPGPAMEVLRAASKTAKVELSAPEMQEGIRLVQRGQSGKDVVEGIIQRRTLAQRLAQSSSFTGLPSDTDVGGVVAAKNRRTTRAKGGTKTKPTAEELLKQYGGEE